MFKIISQQNFLISNSKQSLNFINSISKFHTSNVTLETRWKDLSFENRQNFIRNFVALYKEKHPCSKSNVMYRELSSDMEEHGDTPYAFGILYNELLDVSLGKSSNIEKGKDALGDEAFFNLLYKD